MMQTFRSDRSRLELSDILPVLSNVKQKGNTAVAACPLCEAGDSRGHHLYLKDDGGKLLAYCQKCNAKLPDLLPAFESLGARHDGPVERTVTDEKSYEYKNPDGKTEYFKLRRKFSDGSKVFIFAYRDETGRIIRRKPDGCDNLYNLDRLNRAGEDEPLYIVEGEKCADAMTAHGFLATTANTGAQKQVKLSDTDIAMLKKFRTVYLIPDNDEKGADYAHAWPVTVQVIPMTAIWPECPRKGDIADYFDHGGDADVVRNYRPVTLDEDYFSSLSKNDLVKPDVMKRIYDIKDQSQRECILALAANRAHDLQISRIFSRVWKTFLQENTARGITSENVTKFPAGFGMTLKTGEWIANEHGVFQLYVDENNRPIRKTASPVPIAPTAVYENYEDGTFRFRIAFYLDGKWKRITMPASTISNASKIINLADQGVPVGTENAKLLSSYLMNVIALNPDKLNPVLSSGHLGWVNGSFLPYSREIIVDCDTQYRSLVGNVAERGDLDMWCAWMDHLRENIPFRLTMAASFASPLIEKIGGLPFVFHLWGGTGSGKTVALMAAASIWGNPSMGALTRTLNSTPNALMTSAYILHNIPFFGDELQTIRTRDGNYDKLIMQLTEGINRGRMNSGSEIQKRMEWRNAFLFTGEEPATNPRSGGGVYNRTIEIECTTPLITDGNRVVDFIRHNYGIAGRKYIESLPGDAEIKKRYNDKFTQLITKTDTTEKLAMSMAIILVADELANLIFWPNTFSIGMEKVIPYLKTKQDVDVAERAYNAVIDLVNENVSRFMGPEENAGQIWGIIQQTHQDEDGRDIDIITINKSVLTREMQRMGYNFDAVKKKWKDRGYVILNSQNRFINRTTVYGTKGDYIKIKSL